MVILPIRVAGATAILWFSSQGLVALWCVVRHPIFGWGVFYERCAHLFDCEASRIEGFRAEYRLPRHFVSFEIKAPIIRPAYQESAAAERCSAARSICRIIYLSKGITLFDSLSMLRHPNRTVHQKSAPFHLPLLPYMEFFQRHET